MKKALLGIGVAILVIGIAIFFYLSNRKLDDFNPVIKEKLQSLVRQGSDSLYLLEFDSLEADVLRAKVTLRNIRLLPDSAVLLRRQQAGEPLPDMVKLQLDKLVVEGLGIKDFISAKKIDLDVIDFNAPRLEIFHTKKPDTAAPKSLQSVYQNISKMVNHFALQKLLIRDMSVVQHTMKAGKIQQSATYSHVNIDFSSILIDSLTQYDEQRFLYAQQAEIAVTTQEFRTKDSLYKIRFDSVKIDAAKKTATIQGIRLQPRYPLREFLTKLPFVKERYDLYFQRLQLIDIDWWGIIGSESFFAGKGILSHGKLDIYLDRNLPEPPDSKVGKYPHQLLMKLPLPVNIPDLTVSNFDVSYEEFNPNSMQSGKITFENLHGHITNVTNQPALIKKQPYMKIQAAGTIMKAAPVSAAFTFDLATQQQGIFAVDVHLGKMDATVLNPVARPVGLFSIEKGIINSVDAHINGTNMQGDGSITFLYNDLKVSTLKKGDDGLKKRNLLNFLANAFLVKNDNPGKGKTRTETALYRRNTKLSFFSVIFKTVLIGMMKTVGLGVAVKRLK